MVIQTNKNVTYIPPKQKTQAPSPPPCHEGPKKVMHIGQADIFAGSLAEVHGDTDWDLMIRILTDDIDRQLFNTVRMNEQAKRILPPELMALAEPPPILDLDWPDYGIPKYTREWWLCLNAALRKLGPANVVIFCYGGHGRTGTALSILAGLNAKIIRGRDPVQWVRNRYCHKAVETASQIAYVKQITGLDVESRGSLAWSGYLSSRFAQEEDDGYSSSYDPTLPAWKKMPDGSWKIVEPDKAPLTLADVEFVLEPVEDDEEGDWTGPTHRKPI